MSAQFHELLTTSIEYSDSFYRFKCWSGWRP